MRDPVQHRVQYPPRDDKHEGDEANDLDQHDRRRLEQPGARPLVTARAEHRGQQHEREHHRQILNRSEEHTSELQSLMRISYAVFCLKKHKLLPSKQTYNSTSTLTSHT